jgi:large subunit ribosomal protein L25
VTVEVNVVVEGEAAYGTLVTQDANTITIEADVQSIPDHLTVSVEAAEIGTQFTAGSITLPAGVSLVSDPETLVVNVVAAPTAEDLEGEGAGEAAEEAEGEEGEAAEDEAGEEAPAEASE